MPHMNGWELTRRIRERDCGNSVVIIALSGYGQPEDLRRSEEAGLTHHLVKPFDPGALRSLLPAT